jgi:membrane protease YdiL (CAAX protease family)
MGNPRQRVVLYTILVAVIAGTAFTLKAGPFVMMWTPAMAALVASIISRRHIKEIGWRLGKVKWIGVGWLVPMIIGFTSYGTLWLTGLGAVPKSTFLERARITLGMPHQGDALVILAAYGYIGILGVLPGLIMAVGEEIGWRGFLVPELTKAAGFRAACLWSGIIWALWHWPMVIRGEYSAAGTPLYYQLFCFTLLVMSAAVTAAWLRMKSGSICPVAVMHSAHNAIIQAFFDRITADTGHTRYFVGEFGIAMVPVSLLVAWYFWRRAGEIEAGKDVSTANIRQQREESFATQV